MRKHKRGILIATIIFIGVPFVFFIPGVSLSDIAGGDSAFGPQTVAQVGDVPIAAADFLNQYDWYSKSRTSPSGDRPDPEELMADGTVDQILEQLVNSALLTRKINAHDLDTTQDHLIELLKKDASFLDENGELDKVYFNQWVTSARSIDWNGVYALKRNQMNQRMVLNLASASARVLDEDVRQQYLDTNTKIVVKHIAIEPKVDLSEEEILAFWEDSKETYLTDEERTAEIVTFSLEAPEPPLVEDILVRAAAGEDFVQLASAHSQGPNPAQGREVGWLTDGPNTPDHRKPLFDMEVGAISDPVRGPGGIYIYKVEEKRDSADVEGQQDVRVSEILIRPTLDAEERAARLASAEAFLALAQGEDGFAGAAEKEGLEIQTTDSFSSSSVEIENISAVDAFTFRRELGEVALDGLSAVVTARDFLYVAKVTGYTEPQQKTLEDAREDVDRDAIALHKNGPEYVGAVQQYITDIQSKAGSLEEAKSLFPELELVVNQTNPFLPTDFLFSDGILWSCREAFNAVGRSRPGTMGGPLRDFSNVFHFVELVEKILPAEDEGENTWETEKEVLKETALATLQFERQADYFQYMNEQADAEFLINRNYDAISALLIGDPAEAPEEPAAETSPVSVSDPIETESAESAEIDSEEAPVEAVSEED
jgi:hypothetical protein